MIKKKNLLIMLSAGLLMAASLSSCYYDNVETLTAGTVCDTTAVSYANDVAPILQGNCYVCHGASTYMSTGNGILLEGYEAASSLATAGFLTAVIDWTDGASPMPKGLPQLPACERAKIRNWVDQGALNN